MLDFVEFLSSDSESSVNENDADVCKENSVYEDVQSLSEFTTGNQKQQRTIGNKELQQKRQESIALIKQLQIHVQSLEKEKSSKFYGHKKTSNEEYRTLHDMEIKFNENRNSEYENLKENLYRVTNKLEKFKCDKQSAHKNNVYLEKLKILMEDIESSIMDLKEKQKCIYDDLVADELLLTKEIQNFSKKFEEWSSKQAPQFYDSRMKSKKTTKEVLVPKEVELFQKFIEATGGHLGGWDEFDHQIFMKLHKQHKKPEAFMKAAAAEILTHSVEEIEDHVEWYKEYLLLREQKREAIRNWKKLKQSEKESLLSNGRDVTDLEEEKRKKREELFEKERKERLIQLQQWKAEQRQQKDVTNIDQIEEEKRKMKLKEVLDEKRRLETKLQIQEYKQRKKEEEILRITKEENEKRQQSELSILDRSRIIERNKRMLEQKRIHQITKESDKKDKEERLRRIKEKVAVNVSRDPTRLFKPTEGWKRKQQSSEDNNRAPINTGARALPHRAIPSWRQGIS